MKTGANSRITNSAGSDHCNKQSWPGRGGVDKKWVLRRLVMKTRVTNGAPLQTINSAPNVIHIKKEQKVQNMNGTEIVQKLCKIQQMKRF